MQNNVLLFSLDEVEANENDEQQALYINHQDFETIIESLPDSAKSTRSQSDLERSSTVENNYKCPFCPMNLSRHNYLLMHVAKIHFADKLGIEKSQRKCTFCGKCFGAYTNLVSTPIFVCVVAFYEVTSFQPPSMACISVIINFTSYNSSVMHLRSRYYYKIAYPPPPSLHDVIKELSLIWPKF